MADSAHWNSLALRLVLGLTVLRLLWHAFTPIGLLGDEAYYWEWGRHLDWGYFSKPPLIAWIYGGVGRLTGDSLYAFKATATLLTGGGLWFFYLAVRTVFNEGLAFWALAASALSIGNTLLASILTIDAPLLFCWCLALYLYFRILFAEGSPSWRDTLLLTLALGLGHLSKQMMLVFLPLILVGAWFVRRDLLRKPHLYLASLLSLLFLIPPLFWNLSHDWVTVTHTGHHFQSESFDLAEIAVRFASLGGVSALLLTPIFFVLMLGAIWSVREWSKQPPEIKMLFFFGGAALLLIAVLALRQEINPNWPAVFYPGAIALTTWWCLKGDAPKRAEWFRKSIALGAAFTVVMMVLLPLIDKLGIPAQRRGWRGYPGLAEAVVQEVKKLTTDKIDLLDGNIVVNGHRFTCSQLAFQFRKSLSGDDEAGRVFLWPKPGKISSQYDFWPGLEPGASALIIVERKSEGHPGEPYEDLAGAFEELEELNEIPLHHSRDFPTFKIYYARNFRRWPATLAPTTTP
ncbi:MAG: glycosyltransferase family 39 protein [Roseibacillus sp.]